MFISKKKFEEMQAEAKEKIYAEADNARHERERDERINRCLKDIDQRLRRLEGRRAEEKAVESPANTSGYWV